MLIWIVNVDMNWVVELLMDDISCWWYELLMILVMDRFLRSLRSLVPSWILVWFYFVIFDFIFYKLFTNPYLLMDDMICWCWYELSCGWYKLLMMILYELVINGWFKLLMIWIVNDDMNYLWMIWIVKLLMDDINCWWWIVDNMNCWWWY